jgi:hypothetical protein
MFADAELCRYFPESSCAPFDIPSPAVGEGVALWIGLG